MCGGECVVVGAKCGGGGEVWWWWRKCGGAGRTDAWGEAFNAKARPSHTALVCCITDAQRG